MFFTKKSPKKEQSFVKNIITINAYRDEKYQLKNDIFHRLKRLDYNKSNFYTSYLSNKDVISTRVSLSRNIAEEDISDLLDIKAYEELGLDQASEYVISSREIYSEKEEREFNLFVADPHTLDELYLPIKNQTNYIDLIVPATLLYTVLYNRELLSGSGTDGFLYFTKNDAFITLYKDGEYIYSKSIDFSIEQIYDKYCEIVGEKVDEKEFFSILESEGLETINNDYQKNLMKIFGEAFITINDIIIYAKRAFELDAIDHVYIGSEKGSIMGLDEYSQNYLGIASSDLNFSYNINTDERHVEQLQYMMLLSSLDYVEGEKSLVNLTIYPRSLAFLKRAGGQFILATFTAITIGLAWPLVNLIGSYMNDTKILLMKRENKKLQEIVDNYKNLFVVKQNEVVALDAKMDKLSTVYSGKTKTLTIIYDKKVNYRLKSALFYDLAEMLAKFGVSLESLESKENRLLISVISLSDRKFTELIKYISDKHFDDIDQIDIELIEKDPNSNYYKGVLKVDLR